jgi:hypothetical protein
MVARLVLQEAVVRLFVGSINRDMSFGIQFMRHNEVPTMEMGV